MASPSMSRASSRRRCRVRAPRLVQTGSGGGSRCARRRVRSLSCARSRSRTATCRTSRRQGRGVPNYLGAAVISPDGTQAWVPSKQDNILRGTLRDGRNLNFQNTVRAISSRIDLAAGGRGPGGAHRPRQCRASPARSPTIRCGVYMFVALETSREVAVVDAHGGWEIFRFDVGRAPQGLAVSPDGSTLYVNNFMDRTVGVFDLQPLLQQRRDQRAAARDGECRRDREAQRDGAQGQAVLLRRARYAPGARSLHELRELPQRWRAATAASGISPAWARACATPSRSARPRRHGAGLPALERELRRGAGLRRPDPHARRRHRPDDRRGVQRRALSRSAMPRRASARTSTRWRPTWHRSRRSRQSPYRNADGSLTAARGAGRTVFQNANCAHVPRRHERSRTARPRRCTTSARSSSRAAASASAATLTGIDTPTLRDVWATAPYLHDGSAATLADAVRAHTGVTLSTLRRERGERVSRADRQRRGDCAGPAAGRGTGTGLIGRYFANRTLTGNSGADAHRSR